LRGATRRRLEIQFFPSARPLVPFAADGRSGLGCKGGPRISAWRCKLSTNLSRSRASSGDGEAETASARWNKVLWSFLRLDGAASDTIDGLESCILAGSGEFFCPFLIFSEDSTAIDAIFGEGLGRFAYLFLEESGERLTCNCLGGLPSRLLGCSVFWGGRRCLWLRNPSSSAMRWPVVIFYCLGVHRLYGMSTSLMCYSVWQTKTLFLRREGLRLQVASLALSSTLVCRRLVGGSCSVRRRRRRPGDPWLDQNVIFFFSKGASVRVAM